MSKFLVKRILLGSGDSGKSTVLKQMKIMHKHGFTDMEKSQYKQRILANLLDGLLIVLEQVKVQNLEFSNPVNEVKFAKERHAKMTAHMQV
jgi:hypothetical protein